MFTNKKELHMAKKELTYTDGYIKKLYDSYNSIDLANKLFMKKADFNPEQQNSFWTKFAQIISMVDEQENEKYAYVSSLHGTDKTYLCEYLRRNYKRFVQDSQYHLNLEATISIINKLLEDNWELYNQQKQQRANKSLQTNDEKEREKIRLRPVDVIMDIISSYINLTDTINLNEISTLRY